MTDIPEPKGISNPPFESLQQLYKRFKQVKAEFAPNGDTPCKPDQDSSPPNCILEFPTDYGSDYGMDTSQHPHMCVFNAGYDKKRYAFLIRKDVADAFFGQYVPNYQIHATAQAIQDTANLLRIHDRIQQHFNATQSTETYQTIEDLGAIPEPRLP